jgi:heme exporter protein B
MNFLNSVLASVAKDTLLELRTRYSLAATLGFLVASHFLAGLSLDASSWSPTQRSGIFWILVIFALLVGISRLFSAETERHTATTLRTLMEPDAVFAGKFLSHVLYTLPVILVANGLFMVLFRHLPIHTGAWLLLNGLATLAFGALFTLLGAIAAGAAVRGSLFAILAIPLQIPLLLLLLRCSRYAYSLGWNEASGGDFMALAGFFGAILTAGVLLFEAAWEN